jgi:hypothetical protein
VRGTTVSKCKRGMSKLSERCYGIPIAIEINPVDAAGSATKKRGIVAAMIIPLFVPCNKAALEAFRLSDIIPHLHIAI